MVRPSYSHIIEFTRNLDQITNAQSRPLLLLLPQPHSPKRPLSMVSTAKPSSRPLEIKRGFSLPSIYLNPLPFVASFAHVLLSPDTKVEESFSLHAVHDFVIYGYSLEALSKFDHISFPGPLPRSFIPSLLLSLPVRLLAGPLVRLGYINDKFDLQILTRLTLAFVSSLSLLFVARQLVKIYGRSTGEIFIALCTTQFHLMYYAGRTLPNFLALPFVNISLGLLLSSRPGPALSLLTATAAVIRSELALLLAPIVLLLLATRRMSVVRALVFGALGGFAGMFSSMIVDSTYWSQSYLWPELYTIYFNVVLGKASEWGVSPWYHYLKSLPLLLLATLPLLLFALLHPILRRRTWFLVVPPTTMVLGMSFLGHKEWRFVCYCIVWFNAAGAVAGGWIWLNRRKTWLKSLLALALVGGLIGNVVITTAHTLASVGNYPGGQIMRLLHSIEANSTVAVHLHSPSLPLQSGSTLFHNRRVEPLSSPPSSLFFSSLPYPTPPTPYWIYDKTEFTEILGSAQARQEGFTHVILEGGRFEEGEWEVDGWEVLGSRSGFGGVGWRRSQDDDSSEKGLKGGAKEVLKVPLMKWAVVVKEGEKVVLVRRVDWDR
ncbi:Alg9-like mannosyltransferase family-domain-containing protein [Mrakia frigida]|uniref:dolichyl-P-Man:Man(7)GlcNAc(2)-PP-dolichol alpha-1,6-mannosyltransferase n=1 Tax=Mrakia frigida TaxID=29902 RepID=UPI003FCC1FBA